MSYLSDHYDAIFKKYSNEELIKDIRSYQLGCGRLYKVLNHFFEEEMYKCCGKKTKISPYDCLSDEECTEKILNYIATKPKFFTSQDEVANVKSCLRNSMSWVRKVANFPCRTAKDIYERYWDGENRLNILDTSMGFGSRMSASLLSGHNYCGFDPNQSLFKKLCEYKNWLVDQGIVEEDRRVGLYCGGSEVFRPELFELFDVSFTSPPYFNLEVYSNDKGASSSNYDNYMAWVKEFVKPTVYNTYCYLKTGGYAMINIKNINKKETCYDDFFKAFKEIDGFEFIEVFDMEINKKNYGMAYEGAKGNIVNKEPVMVFRKIR